MTTRSDATVEVDGAAILANARALEPLIRDRADEIESERRLVPAVVDALRSAGVFRMSMPRSWGGPEVGLPEQVEIVEAVSRADGSAGWCTMIGSDSGFYSAYLADDVGRELWPGLDAVTAGWLFPVGRLDRDGDGYRLSGRWSFASACTHADVMVAGALVWDGDGGADGPVWRPTACPSGGWRCCPAPPSRSWTRGTRPGSRAAAATTTWSRAATCRSSTPGRSAGPGGARGRCTPGRARSCPTSWASPSASPATRSTRPRRSSPPRWSCPT